MVVPLAACKGGPVVPAALSAQVTDTWAPVSTKKRCFDLLSVTNSCVALALDERVASVVVEQHRGPTAKSSTAGPLSCFPGAFCVGNFYANKLCYFLQRPEKKHKVAIFGER